ncbi:MAG TPA: DUF1015 domain-containing protein [Polyangia bacterium]|nr:DUF1015 domain-containing protein [Polyangia bacterium]
MAEIAPFRGILYDPKKAGRADRLLAPPYDVINDADRARLAALDPHNCVRLILPKDAQGGDSDGKYAEAARELNAWLDEGVLRRDDAPALYRYHQIFKEPGEGGARTFTRKGFICRIRLRRFDEGVVLPHERTLAGPKADRLKLKRATRCHLSQVFGLYSDPERSTDAPFEKLEREAPLLDGTTTDGVTQRLWRLTDAASQNKVVAALADKKVYIADGHHRYETMLALRDELRAESGGNPRSSVEFGTIFLANMDDPGLLVFPTHRVVHGLESFDFARLIEGARAFFTADELKVTNAAAVRAELAERGRRAPTFAAARGNRIVYLTLRGDVDLTRVPSLVGPQVVRQLDVTLLHALIIEYVLGIDRAAQERQTNLRYVKDTAAALAEAGAPGVQAVFVMNPTPVAQVKAVADAGEVMPQKSTFFYPKLASGLVLNPIVPSEEA